MSLSGAFDVLRLGVVTVDIRQSPDHSERGVVAVAVCDGFYGCGSGAGWSNRALIEILAEVLPVEIDLVILPVPVDVVSSGWQREWRYAVEEALGRSGRRVEVRALDGNRGEPSHHGEPELTRAVEQEATRLRGEYRCGLILLCDVRFSGAAEQSVVDSAWTTVIVPRTSTLLIKPELVERVVWERESLRRAAMADADTRERMREHGREILRGFDYRDSVRSLLRQAAPWLIPVGQPSVRVGAAAGRPAAGRSLRVVQALS